MQLHREPKSNAPSVFCTVTHTRLAGSWLELFLLGSTVGDPREEAKLPLGTWDEVGRAHCEGHRRKWRKRISGVEICAERKQDNELGER